ncbi:hypothetical protein [Neisseria yangbaofengii]|uniref:hypothetical protein n=1 Tax=Neisseria yangbaofengii TaxID=2709396 RepID=UPI0013EAFC9C|nr:hypothetical protein [Neisseria yangbaofengii]
MHQSIVEQWKKLYRRFDELQCREYETKEQLSSLFYSINQSINVAVLSAVISTDKVQTHLNEIETVIQRQQEWLPINQKDEAILHQHLEALDEIFENVDGLPFFKALDEKMNTAILAAQKRINEKSDDFFGRHTSKHINYEFNQQYKNIKLWLIGKQLAFYTVLIGLLFFNLWLICYGFHSDIPSSVFLMLKLSVAVPAVWLLFHLSAQIKEDRKLKQAYLHKAVIAKSYMNYAQSFNDQTFVGDKEVKKEMITLLLKLSVETLRENPAELLLKNPAKDDSGNMQSVIEKLIDKLPNYKTPST